jgi:CheY-like chemotaxis protein
MELERDCRPVEILLVEDNPGDVRLTLEAFREGKIRNRLIMVSDGVEALAFLRRQGCYANAPGRTSFYSILTSPKRMVATFLPRSRTRNI